MKKTAPCEILSMAAACVVLMWSYGTATGVEHACLKFDGINDYVKLPSAIDLDDTFTIEFWMRPDTLQNYGDPVSAFYDQWLCFVTYADGHMFFSVGTGGDWGPGVTTAAGTFQNGVWAHVAGVVNGNQITLYVNGKLVGSCSDSSNTLNQIITFGARLSTSYYFNGQLDEIRIWNDVRTESEIRANMHRTMSGAEAGLEACYPMTAGSGASLVDLTGNGHNGTLMNMGTADWVASSAFDTWIGGQSDGWSTAMNWSRGSIPGSTENVGIYKWPLGNDVTINGAPTVENLLVATNASPTLSSGLTVNGSLLVKNDVDLNGQTIALGSEATLAEDGGRFHGSSGEITTTCTLSNIDRNVGGLGMHITTTANMGSTTITRRHAAQPISRTNVITRYYDITPANNTGLNATVVFHYDEAELNGAAENTLCLYRSLAGSSGWQTMSGTNDLDANSLTLDGISSFSRWTAGRTGTPWGLCSCSNR